MKKMFKKIIAITLTLVLIATYLPAISFVDTNAAVSKFTFDGTNVNEYANQPYIIFDMVNVDGTNAQLNELVKQVRTLPTAVTFEFSSKVRVIGKGVYSENGVYTGVFEAIYNLATVNFAKATSLTVIENQAFRNCTILAQSVYKSNNKYITTAIESVSTTQGVKQLGTLHLPANLTYLGEAVFANTLMYKIEIDKANDSYESVDGVLYNNTCNEIVLYPPARYGNFSIPETVSSIYQYAFEECLIGKVIIPASVSNIGKRAFYNSSLTAVTFAQDCSISMGNGAFYQDPKDDRFIGMNKWDGISQVTISETTYNKSTNYINNQDNTACFTPFTESSGAEGSFAKGCDIYVEPNVTVTGIPLVWTGSANLNFYWASNAFYTIESLYLEKHGEVTFEKGSYASNSITVKESGSYDLTIGYVNKNGNSQTKTITIDIDKIDSYKPSLVTYTLVDDVCYLHSYDLESGLDQIKYELNNNDVRTYTSTGFTLSPGYNKVTAWSTDNVGNASEKVTFNIPIGTASRGIKLNVNSKELAKNNTFTLKTTFTPADTINQDVVYTSSDVSICTVDDNGVVKGINSGYAVITATSVSGMKDKCAVVVTEGPYVMSELEMYKTNKYTLYINDLRDDYDYYFESDDPSIASVNEQTGVIKAKGIGECTITATVDAGMRVYKLPCTVVVYEPEVIITTTPKYIKVKQKYKFKASKSGLSAGIKWTSSNKKVATINKSTGRVVGRKKGTTTIKAKVGSYYDTFKLKVK